MDRLDELSLLIEIVDGGSLAEGARRTRRSPAAVTRCLNGMERRLGVRLIERTTRWIAPTEAGRRLVEHARRVLDGYSDALQDVTDEASTAVGVLRVTAPLAFGRMHVAPVVSAFLALHPQVRIELQLTNAVVELRENGIDVALRIGHLEDSTLVAKQVGEVRHLVVGSPEYFARCGRPQDIADLAQHEAILLSGADGVREWKFNVPGRGPVRVRPPSRLSINQAEATIEAACAGRGLIRVLSYQVVSRIESGELVPVLRELEMPPTPVSLVFAGTRFMPLRLRLFLDHAAGALRRSAAFRSVGSGTP
jgi:DNA-binding transcriptional LysR family regulator